MNLFNSFKQYILIIVITVALGYFLGITVSTVVDYRLKDAVINLPKPKNNIIVKLNDKDIKLSKKNKKSKGKKNKGKKNKNKKNKDKKNKDKKNKEDKKDKNKKAIIENFANPNPFDNITNLESLPGPANITVKVRDPWQFRSKGIVDPTILNYSNLLKKNNKKIEKQKEVYKPANEEDTDQLFEPIIAKNLQKGTICKIRQ